MKKGNFWIITLLLRSNGKRSKGFLIIPRSNQYSVRSISNNHLAKDIVENIFRKLKTSISFYKNLHDITCNGKENHFIKLIISGTLRTRNLENIDQKQPSRGVHREIFSENIQQLYRRTPMSKWDFNKVALQLYWSRTSTWQSLMNLRHNFRTPFPKKTSGRLLLRLDVIDSKIYKFKKMPKI